MVDRVRETKRDGFILIERAGDGGYAEIGIYYDRQPKKLAAVISRQITGGKWCVYLASLPGCWRFRVKRDAVAHALFKAQHIEVIAA